MSVQENRDRDLYHYLYLYLYTYSIARGEPALWVGTGMLWTIASGVPRPPISSIPILKNNDFRPLSLARRQRLFLMERLGTRRSRGRQLRPTEVRPRRLHEERPQ
jgi:hypothetical protein